MTNYHTAITGDEMAAIHSAFAFAVDCLGRNAIAEPPAVRAYANGKCYVGVEIGDTTLWTDGGYGNRDDRGPFVINALGRDVSPPPAVVREKVDATRGPDWRTATVDDERDFDKPGPVGRTPLTESWDVSAPVCLWFIKLLLRMFGRQTSER